MLASEPTARPTSGTIIRNVASEILQRVDWACLEVDGYTRQIQPEDCVVLLNVHLLTSSVNFFKRLLQSGFQPESIVVIPKRYSTIAAAEDDLRKLNCVIVQNDEEECRPGFYDDSARGSLKLGVEMASQRCALIGARRCVLIDDGGLLTDIWCRTGYQRRGFDVISIQQTRSGLYPRRQQSPAFRINVGQCAAKVRFESKVIARGAIEKVQKLDLLSQPAKVGIIGLGHIGSSLWQVLSHRGHTVNSFDLNPQKLPYIRGRQESWQRCVTKSEIVFGCTGRNTTLFQMDVLQSVGARKTFLSMSSRDIEFQSLLRCYTGPTPKNCYDDIAISIGGLTHVVRNGGFPVNFDRDKEWERGPDISLTRGLTLLAVFQALCIGSEPNPFQITSIPPMAQKEFVATWLQLTGQHVENFDVTVEEFEETRWWQLNSKSGMLRVW
jgi:hypothetical protein